VFVSEEALRFTFTTASGPGGQNVNKVSTRAVLRVALADVRGLSPFLLGRLAGVAQGGGRLVGEAGSAEILISCQETRSQQRNREAALEELRAMIVAAKHVPKARRKTKPSAGAKRRRLEGKKIRSEVKKGRSGRDFG
jgi:ribosome-associated protein